MEFRFRSTAEAIVADLTAPIAVHVEELRDALALDVEVRMSEAAKTVKRLLDDGLHFERLVFVIRWSQTWRAQGADPMAQRL